MCYKFLCAQENGTDRISVTIQPFIPYNDIYLTCNNLKKMELSQECLANMMLEVNATESQRISVGRLQEGKYSLMEAHSHPHQSTYLELAPLHTLGRGVKVQECLSPCSSLNAQDHAILFLQQVEGRPNATRSQGGDHTLHGWEEIHCMWWYPTHTQ